MDLKVINGNKAIKEIVTNYDNLSKRCDEFNLSKENTEAQEIILDLKNVIRANEDMVGLSANQIGYNKRILCLNFNGDIKTFINPIITNVKGMELSREKCHSIPDKEFIRIRNTQIEVTYQTPLGKIESKKLLGKAAIVMQHHIDHLDGLLLNDVSLEIDENWDKATDEEREEVINMYLDSLDITSRELNKELESNEEAMKLKKDIEFAKSVISGETKIAQVPLTEEEQSIVEEYKKEYIDKE